MVSNQVRVSGCNKKSRKVCIYGRRKTVLPTTCGVRARRAAGMCLARRRRVPLRSRMSSLRGALAVS